MGWICMKLTQSTHRPKSLSHELGSVKKDKMRYQPTDRQTDRQTDTVRFVTDSDNTTIAESNTLSNLSVRNRNAKNKISQEVSIENLISLKSSY